MPGEFHKGKEEIYPEGLGKSGSETRLKENIPRRKKKKRRLKEDRYCFYEGCSKCLD